MFSYDLTDEDYALPYNAPGKSSSYFDLDDHFGKGYPSRRSDGVKLQTILGNSGDFDMERVGGPTGWGEETLDQGIKSFQKRNGLEVDGWVRPGGPTITKMKEQYGGLLSDFEAPTPKQADTNLRLRDAGHSGFLKSKRQELLLPPIPGLPKPDDNILGANHSLVRTVRDNGLRDTPDWMAKSVRRNQKEGVVEARDFVNQLEQLIPGEGTKAVRGILQALADTPQLQQAFFGGPVIETAPIGVFEQGGPRRYEEAIKTRPWEEVEQGGKSGTRTMDYVEERDGPPQPARLKPAYDPNPLEPQVRLLNVGADAPTYNDGLLDPTSWPEHLRGQSEEVARATALQTSRAEEIDGQVTASDKEDEDASAIQIAQAQQPQQQRPQQGQQQPQNQPRQREDRYPSPPRPVPRGPEHDQQTEPPAQAQQPNDQQPENYPAPPRLRPLRRGEAPPHPLDRVGEWESRPDLIPSPGFAGQSWSEASPSFRRNLAIAENNNTRPNPGMQHEANREGGGREQVLGQYQIKDTTLAEIGLKDRDGAWIPGRLYGTVDGVRREIRSNEDFLKATDAQDEALSRVMESYRAQAERRGLDRHIGQKIDGKEHPVLITETGLAAAAHRGGVGAVNAYINRLQRNDWDSNRARQTITRDGDRKLHDAIETRLRLFANEALFR